MLEKINPNHLTTLRLLLAPLTMYLLLHPTAPALVLCLGLMTAIELTDFFDGYIARKHNRGSDFGKIYDPMCDAIYHLLMFICLIPSGLSVWIVGIFLAREVAMSYLRTYCAMNGLVLAARPWGKLKAVFQMIFLFAMVLYLLLDQLAKVPILAGIVSAVTILSGVIAILLTVYSFVDYLHFVRRAVRQSA